MIYGLKEQDIQRINDVFSKFDMIEQAIIYGSRAKGNYKPASDIDLTIEGKLDTTILNRIAIELDDLLLPYTFDLSILHQIKDTDMLDHIKRMGKVFYSK